MGTVAGIVNILEGMCTYFGHSTECNLIYRRS